MASDEKWYFTKEQLAGSPSRKCGIDGDKELSYRQQAANFIQDMGQRLVVTQLCINTAIVYMHRFYVYHSLSQFHRNAIASAALFLAAKVEEQPRKLEHVIKVAHLCLHREQTTPDTKSEVYLEQAQDLVFNENVILQTLGFDVAIDHPHTHVVRCCHLVKASKDLAQTSYFMASNSLHLTTMCLQYKPTVVACFCIHLACKWSNWEIPQSNEGKHWFWYVDKSVTSELLQQLTAEFLHIFDKCPSRLKRKVMSISANQSPNMNHPGLTSSPFDAEPRKVQSPANADWINFQCNRPFLLDKNEDKKHSLSASTRPAPDFREHKDRKEKERNERDRSNILSLSSAQGFVADTNKQHFPHHKQMSSVSVQSKHLLSLNSNKPSLHHNHHHRQDTKRVSAAIQQKHSTNVPSRDPNRLRISKEYNVNVNTGSGIGYLPNHNSTKDSNSDNLVMDIVSRSESNLQHDSELHIVQDKLGNNNHRLSIAENKYYSQDKHSLDQRPNKSAEYRKESEVRCLKFSDQARNDRHRKSDSLEQRSEEVRKLIEKPILPPIPRTELQKEEYTVNMLKQPHYTKYNQLEKQQSISIASSTDTKISNSEKSVSVSNKSPCMQLSVSIPIAQRSGVSKPLTNQLSMCAVPQVIKDSDKNGNSQSILLDNADTSKIEKKQTLEDTDKYLIPNQSNSVRTTPNKYKSLFSPEKIPASQDVHSQVSKSKQITAPTLLKLDSMPFKHSSNPQHQLQTHPKRVFNSGRLMNSTSSVKLSSSQKSKHRVSNINDNEKDRNNLKSQQQSNMQKFVSGSEIIESVAKGSDPIPYIKNIPSSNSRSVLAKKDPSLLSFVKQIESQSPLQNSPSSNTLLDCSITNSECSGSQNYGKEDLLLPKVDFIPMEGKPATQTIYQNLESKEEVGHKSAKSEASKVAFHHSRICNRSPAESPYGFNTLGKDPLGASTSIITQTSVACILNETQPKLESQSLFSNSLVPAEKLIRPLQSDFTSSIPSSVDNGLVAVTAESSLSVSSIISASDDNKCHKVEKKKKEKKHKHKDKEKAKDKHRHKHKDKVKHREKDKIDEGSITTAPIKITIPKDKILEVAMLKNPSLDRKGTLSGSSLKIKIPKERLKNTDVVSRTPVAAIQAAQPPVQAPLKIKIRKELSGLGVSTSNDFCTTEGKKRERSETQRSPSEAPAPKKQFTTNIMQQRPSERQNGHPFSSGANNKVLEFR